MTKRKLYFLEKAPHIQFTIMTRTCSILLAVSLLAFTNAMAQNFKLEVNETLKLIEKSDLDEGQQKHYGRSATFSGMSVEIQGDSIFIHYKKSIQNGSTKGLLKEFLQDCTFYNDAFIWDNIWVFDTYNSDASKKEIKQLSKKAVPGKKFNESFFKDLFYVHEEEGRYGIKNHYGELVLETEYEHVAYGESLVKQTYPKLFRVKQKGESFLFEIGKGKISEDSYERLNRMIKGTMIAKKASKYFIINHEGKDLNEGRFTHIEEPSARNIQNYIFVGNEKFALADREGNLISEMIYVELKDFGIDRFKVKVGEYWGVMDNEGRILIEPKYRNITGFNKEYYCAIKEDGCSLHRKSGELFLETKFKTLQDANEDLLIVKTSNNKHGYANWKGELMIEDVYDYAGKFEHGKGAIVKVKNKYGLIDVNGNPILEIVFDHLSKSRNGYKARIKQQEISFDINGNCLKNCEYKNDDLLKGKE